jgi:prepilin-type N-terminal cleavage/methylation domain-containing protein
MVVALRHADSTAFVLQCPTPPYPEQTMLRNRKGFTLIELMIVVVIIGILAAIAIPKFSQVSKTSKQSEAGSILKQICTLARTYQDQKGGVAYAAADIDDFAAVGWDATTSTNAKYFTFTFTGGTATATPKDATQVSAQTMDCATGTLSDPA